MTANYTSPKTYTGTEVLNAAADLNTYERDNIAYLGEPPTCQAYSTSGAVATLGVWRSVPLQAERWDTNSMHSTVSNTDRITAPEAGIYLITAHVTVSASSAGTILMTALERNTAGAGTGFATQFFVLNAVSPIPPTIVGATTLAAIVSLAASDYITLAVYANASGHTFGGTVTMTRIRDDTHP